MEYLSYSSASIHWKNAHYYGTNALCKSKCSEFIVPASVKEERAKNHGSPYNSCNRWYDKVQSSTEVEYAIIARIRYIHVLLYLIYKKFNCVVN